MKLRYDKVTVGQSLIVSSDGQKEKRSVVVSDAFTYKTKYDDMMVRLTMNDGSVFYGWSHNLVWDGNE